METTIPPTDIFTKEIIDQATLCLSHLPDSNPLVARLLPEQCPATILRLDQTPYPSPHYPQPRHHMAAKRVQQDWDNHRCTCLTKMAVTIDPDMECIQSKKLALW